MQGVDWNEVFEEKARENQKAWDECEARANTPEGVAKRKAEIEREIRQGLRDANGDWIETPESDEPDDDDESEDEE